MYLLYELAVDLSGISRPRGYKTFIPVQLSWAWNLSCSLTIANYFLLNKAEHETFSANKYENANYCWHLHIYLQRKFHARLSWTWKMCYNLGASHLNWFVFPFVSLFLFRIFVLLSRYVVLCCHSTHLNLYLVSGKGCVSWLWPFLGLSYLLFKSHLASMQPCIILWCIEDGNGAVQN